MLGVRRGASLLATLLAAPCTAVALTAQGMTEIARAMVGGEEVGDHSGDRTRMFRPRNSTEQHIMVCNAYAYSKPLHVYNVRSQQRLTGKEPLGYKECGDYTVWLREGDQLDFRTSAGSLVEDDVREREAGEHSVGIFRAWGLPKVTSSLLLVPHRQGSSMSIAFESHVFRELGHSQLVVVDAYLGRSYGRLTIVENPRPNRNDTSAAARTRAEELHFDAAVALKPGNYELVLTDILGDDVSVQPLTVEAAKRKFVVIRVGVDEDLHYKVGNATELPQELLLHQQVTTEEKSAAAPRRLFPAAALAASVAWLLV